MGYSESLEAAGAKVLAYEEFGDYQGSWAAHVEYKGENGIAFGSYGSCSGCDSFQAEFDYHRMPEEREGKYFREYWDDEEITKEEYDSAIAEYQKKLSDFGEGYLTSLANELIIQTRLANLTKDEDDWFDEDEKKMLDWCLEKLQTKN